MRRAVHRGFSVVMVRQCAEPFAVRQKNSLDPMRSGGILTGLMRPPLILFAVFLVVLGTVGVLRVAFDRHDNGRPMELN
jgi:hypothetical protein